MLLPMLPQLRLHLTTVLLLIIQQLAFATQKTCLALHDDKNFQSKDFLTEFYEDH